MPTRRSPQALAEQSQRLLHVSNLFATEHNCGGRRPSSIA